MYRLLFTDDAKELYDSLRGKLRRQVDKALARIAENPMIGKPLRHDLKGLYSERVLFGSYTGYISIPLRF